MVESRFTKIRMRWPMPFADIEANYSILVADLQCLGTKLSEIAASVGVVHPLQHSKALTLWESVEGKEHLGCGRRRSGVNDGATGSRMSLFQE